MLSSGVLVGCDQRSEWLLPWWWKKYTLHNLSPVAFIDFGMSKKGRLFCQKRGELISLKMDETIIKEKHEVDPKDAILWEATYGQSLWQLRHGWYKKPFALLQTPFEKTLWLDLDCEVLGPIQELFTCLENAEIALARETEAAVQNERLLRGEVLYNSGVIAFKKDSSLVRRWAEEVPKKNGWFWGDQNLLSRLIFLEKHPIYELDSKYNWRVSQGLNIDALIIHWVGSWGKSYIRKHGGLSEELESVSDFFSSGGRFLLR